MATISARLSFRYRLLSFAGPEETDQLERFFLPEALSSLRSICVSAARSDSGTPGLEGSDIPSQHAAAMKTPLYANTCLEVLTALLPPLPGEVRAPQGKSSGAAFNYNPPTVPECLRSLVRLQEHLDCICNNAPPVLQGVSVLKSRILKIVREGLISRDSHARARSSHLLSCFHRAGYVHQVKMYSLFEGFTHSSHIRQVSPQMTSADIDIEVPVVKCSSRCASG